jgi:hypothetical protein
MGHDHQHGHLGRLFRDVQVRSWYGLIRQESAKGRLGLAKIANGDMLVPSSILQWENEGEHDADT